MHPSEANVAGANKDIDRATAVLLSKRSGARTAELFHAANARRLEVRGNAVDICSIVNAKSGACPEDCSFCAQSSRSDAKTETYPLVSEERILEAARGALKNGAQRFCIVTSGKKTGTPDLERICKVISSIRSMGLLPCATLGLLGFSELSELKSAGLHRYHHNLETSEAFFSEICTTHTYREKVKTIEAARSAGLSLCSGGIFGLGESWDDRIDMAYALKDLDVDSVPVNFLTPVPGTPVADSLALDPLEALKVISLYRLILPRQEIRVCGGRQNALRDLHSCIFFAGADGFLIGNYLTTPGRDPADDLQMIRDLGLEF